MASRVDSTEFRNQKRATDKQEYWFITPKRVLVDELDQKLNRANDRRRERTHPRYPAPVEDAGLAHAHVHELDVSQDARGSVGTLSYEIVSLFAAAVWLHFLDKHLLDS